MYPVLQVMLTHEGELGVKETPRNATLYVAQEFTTSEKGYVSFKDAKKESPVKDSK
jgi:hypothetical protein